MKKRMEKVKKIVEDADTLPGRIFDVFILLMIVLSLAIFPLETLPDLSPSFRQILHYGEILLVSIFTVEYLLRILVAEKKGKFIFSFYGIVDLLAIIPFFLTLGFDLRFLRTIRFLRVIRLLKLVRYNKALQRFHKAFLITKEEIILFLFITMLLLYFAAVGIYIFEHEAQPEKFQSIFHSLWWAITTLSTVGYGDSYPVTTGGKIFTTFILLIGLGIVTVPAGLVSSALSKARLEEDATENTKEEFG